jgi:maleylpyruvate isomerase
MKLYGYWRSSSSYRVRIALHHKGIPFDYVPIHLLRDGGEQFGPEHRARSPMAKVPALELPDGRVLTESLAILEYLEETHPERPLLPGDPYLRARARMLAELVNSGIQPLQNLSVLRHVKDALGGDDKAWLAHWVGGGLAALERAVTETAGAFCVGDAPSLADVCLVPELHFARRNGLDLTALPALVRIDAACQPLPAFVAAHPDVQPDAPR